MKHGGDTYQKNIRYDFSVSLNPFVPKERLVKAGVRALNDSGRYPDPYQRRIRTLIANDENVSPENVLAGNGASELLTGVVRYINPKRGLLFVPGYSGYEYALDTMGNCEKMFCRTKESNGFLPDLSDLEKALSEGNMPEMMFLCDPWNPSGKLFSKEERNTFLKRADAEGIWVVLDLSFELPGKETESAANVSEIIKRYPRTVVLKSYTKLLSLPGVRMGYIVAQNGTVSGIRDVLPEWNLSVPAEYILEEGLKLSKDEEYLSRLRSRIQEERNYLTTELTGLGMKVFDSDSCFIYFKAEEEIAARLSKMGIWIREYDYAEYPEGFYYRIGIKEHEANAYLTDCLKKMKQE